MSISIRDLNVTRTAVAMRVGASNTSFPVRQVRQQVGAVLRTIANFVPELTLSVSLDPIFGQAIGLGPQPVFSDETTAIPSGGLPPYSYAWTMLSNPSGEASLVSVNTATTSVSATLENTAVSGTIRCTVTDALNRTATADVDFTLQHSDFL